jgi:hypothetical protein
VILIFVIYARLVQLYEIVQGLRNCVAMKRFVRLASKSHATSNSERLFVISQRTSPADSIPVEPS